MATEKKKIGLHLDTDALTMLAELAPSENKKGEYLSGLIRAAHAQQSAPPAAPVGPDQRQRLLVLAGDLAALGDVARALLTDPQASKEST